MKTQKGGLIMFTDGLVESAGSKPEVHYRKQCTGHPLCTAVNKCGSIWVYDQEIRSALSDICTSFMEVAALGDNYPSPGSPHHHYSPSSGQSLGDFQCYPELPPLNVCLWCVCLVKSVSECTGTWKCPFLCQSACMGYVKTCTTGAEVL